MPGSLLARYTITFPFIYLLLSKCVNFAVTTTTLDHPTAKLAFIFEEIHKEDLESTFDNILKEAIIFSPLRLEGITIIWKVKDTPDLTWAKINENIILRNASAVLSFLPPWKNQVLVNVLSASVIPVIGMESLIEDIYNNKKDGVMYLSMLPTEALQASVLKDLMVEFEESRFACITTESSRDDSLFSHLSGYLTNKYGQQATWPRCIILNQETLLEQFSAGLAAISAYGLRTILVHCTSDESEAIMKIFKLLSFEVLREFVWIFTDNAIGWKADDFPESSFGVKKAPTIGNDSILALSKGLLNDSVKLFVRSLERSVGGLSHSSMLQCLQGNLFSSYKRTLFREMISSSFLGQTGAVRFNPNGERSSFKFSIVKVMRKPEGGLYWNIVGHVEPEASQDNAYGPSMFEPFLPKDLPRPRHLRIVSIDQDPFTAFHDMDYSTRLGTNCPANTVPCTQFDADDNNPSGTQAGNNISLWNTRCCYGLMIDILIKLQEIEKFTFDLYLVADGKYGSLDPVTKQMNGMIGDVYRGFADLALGMITATEKRSQYVDFTTPFMDTALMFLVKINKSTNKNFWEFISDMRLMKSFSTLLWLMCLAAFLTVVVSVYVIEKLYYYRQHKSAYLLPFEFIMYVYGNVFHVPLTKIEAQTYSVPFVMVVANFAGLVLISSYTANLLASLITLDETVIVTGIADPKGPTPAGVRLREVSVKRELIVAEKPVFTPEDPQLVDPPEGFTFGTIKDTSTEDFFKKSKSERLRKIYENMKEYNVENFAEAVKKVRTGELTVFISELGAGDEDPNCEIKQDGLPFELGGLAFALPKNSSWNHPLSHAIHKLKAEHIITEIFGRWTPSRCENSQQTVVAHKMGLDEFGGFLFNTAMISLGCFFILLAEIIVYHRITRNRKSFSPHQNGVAMNSFRLPESTSMISILNTDTSVPVKPKTITDQHQPP